MRRGTTPTLTFPTSTDLTGASELYLTFDQGGGTVFEKTLADVTITADQIECPLTQEETFLLSHLKYVRIQAAAKIVGKVLRSNILSGPVGEILKDELI